MAGTLQGAYCNSLTEYSRFRTREIYIGDIPLGAENPIRIQSMTTTNTMDTKGTVEQTIRMVEAGCEYVRITAPSIKEAENLAVIKKELLSRGYKVPLIADIHFTPNAAETAARIVEKVRVNPGNFADKKRFETIEYTPAAYEAELERIRRRFEPLVRICKEHGTAMRIGTNHGSLSDRIMSWYGDTPRGMVESAMEFMRICSDLDYHELVISMKASNPQVMVQAYRLLVETMVAEGMNYPLHLGVTEAGDGEDGRIKSAVGIGTLLEDGLGDTIRVSLTEEPEFEVPVARELANRYHIRERSLRAEPKKSERPPAAGDYVHECFPAGFSPYEYNKRASAELNTFIGGNQVPRVVLDLSAGHLKDPAVLAAAGYLYSPVLDKYHMGEQSVDFVYLGGTIPSFSMPGNLKQLYDYSAWLTLPDKTNCHPLFSLEEFVLAGEAGEKKDHSLNLVRISPVDTDTSLFARLVPDATLVFVLETGSMTQQRAFFFRLMEIGLDTPVIIRRSYSPGIPAEKEIPAEDSLSVFQLYAATDAGALLVDGLGDGLWLDAVHIPAGTIVSTAFGILQATRSRISKTEYISCPSCGRTLFDLQETTQLIRSRTSHLKGIKIGIMGCIVNGPGEMADADYGYVGTGPGKITLYRGKEVVRKNVNTENAVDELIGLIREDGNWVEPA
ncbi:(E)-4-hydroxy-3-methylbut-2-enyl-diphosphate synthase [Anseongella ginsenosidimutans]|nr:(E)-4-hydroxy-3-methylbut-2-enyl-diphosphate synthase [Anseongella ginsenosidimutans]